MKLAVGVIDCWQIDLCGDSSPTLSCPRWLSREEIQRGESFHCEKDRRHFTAARSATRDILGRYLNHEARDLIFSYSARGKPELSEEMNELGLTFNLSHSGERALLAVARGLCLGVDIELVNRKLASEKIAECFFSMQEVAELRAIPPKERVEAFFCC